MNREVALVAILTAVLLASTAPAAKIAEDTFDSSMGLLDFQQIPDPGTFTSIGDAFDVFQAEGSDTWPPQLVDRSAIEGETDNLGIIDVTSKTDAWFGVTDTANNDNLMGEYRGRGFAEWVFDISGTTSLSASIEIGAMGDFEENDVFNWTYAIDGGDPEPLFVSSVDLEGSYVYTMADGETTREFDDPLLINEVMVTNLLESFSAPIAGTGSELTITFIAAAEGGTEGIAFDNLVISGTIDNGGGDPDAGPGDYNDSGLVEQGDLDLVLLGWGSNTPGPTWVHQLPGTDGFSTDLIDQEELDEVLLNWGESVTSTSLLGDYNESGAVEQADLDLVLLAWGGDTPGSTWTDQLPGTGDFDTAQIDQEELDRVLLNWGNSVALAAAVPEPSGMVMILIAVVTGSCKSLRRRRYTD